MLFDERTAKYFMTLVEQKSITEAAAELYISQPSMSKFLLKLERELGVPLFHRRNGCLQLTQYGEKYQEYVREAEQLNQRMRRCLSKRGRRKGGILRVGAGAITSPFLAYGVIPEFQKEYPDIRIRMLEDVHTGLIRRQQTGQADMILIVGNDERKDDRGIVRERIRTERRLVAIAKTNAYVQSRPDRDSCTMDTPGNMNPKDLNGQTVISGMPGQRITEDLKKLQKKYDIRYRDIIFSQNIQSHLAMAVANLGVLICPSFYHRHDPEVSKLSFFFFDDPLMEWSLDMCYRGDNFLKEKRRFIELTRRAFQ